MANLNWRQKQLGQELREEKNLVFVLAPSERDALAQALGELFAEDAPAAELRVDLPRGWILFWKPRQGESRLLLSHPSKDEYVATAALLSEHGRRFAARVAGLVPGASASVAQAAEDTPVAGLSNVDIVIQIS